MYKTIWTPLLGETLEVEQEDDNDHDEYQSEEVTLLGPREITRVCIS